MMGIPGIVRPRGFYLIQVRALGYVQVKLDPVPFSDHQLIIQQAHSLAIPLHAQRPVQWWRSQQPDFGYAVKMLADQPTNVSAIATLWRPAKPMSDGDHL
jgi:hypothetical protein